MKAGYSAFLLLFAGIAANVMLLASTEVYAGDRESSPLNIQFDRNDWYIVDANMSPEEYQRACRKNKRTARRAIASYSKEAFTSLGVPEIGVKLMGTAVSLATRTTKLHVNESKTMAFELKNVVGDDRTLMFGINFDW